MGGQAAAAVLPNSRYRRSHRDRPGDNSGRPDLDLKPAWAAGRRVMTNFFGMPEPLRTGFAWRGTKRCYCGVNLHHAGKVAVGWWGG